MSQVNEIDRRFENSCICYFTIFELSLFPLPHKTISRSKYKMTDGFRGNAIGSKRGFLASLWSIVTILTAISFLTAFIFALSTTNDENGDNSYYNYNNNGNGGEGSQDDEAKYDPEVAVTSRALAFSALWAGVLAALLSVFGTVILGWQSPTGLYYTCCSSSVHRTTPLGIGSFIGALLMFANLTLVCSVLFGEFQVSVFK